MNMTDIPDLSPLALRLGAIAGIITACGVIWRVFLKPFLEATQEIAGVGRRLVELAEPEDPRDPHSKPRIVGAVDRAVEAVSSARDEATATRDEIRKHAAEDRACFQALADWSGQFTEFEPLTLPPPTEVT